MSPYICLWEFIMCVCVCVLVGLILLPFIHHEALDTLLTLFGLRFHNL